MPEKHLKLLKTWVKLLEPIFNWTIYDFIIVSWIKMKRIK